jgi:hypothetical protein
MASAEITLPDGITVTVEGSPDEISSVVERLKGNGNNSASLPGRAPSLGPYRAKSKRPQPRREQIGDLVGGLIEDGFFRPPKTLGDVRSALAQRGHHYPRTTLSPLLLRLVRKRDLRRLQENGRWVYTH